MTVMVTGAGGFVGLNLMERLLADGRKVVGFSREPIDPGVAQRLARLPGALVAIEGDVLDADALRGALRAHGVTKMVHMAAITSAADRERRAAAEVIEVNLAGLAIALTEAAKAGIDRFLYTGSIAVFGPRTEDGAPIEEDHPHDPASLYAITKSAGEAVVARLGGLMELDWAIGRLGRVFGPYEHDTGVRDTLSQIYQVTRAARQGRPVCFDRPCVKNWNYARDVAVDLALLLDAPYLRHRIYNLGAPYAWSLADWCARLAARPQGFSYRVGPGPGDRIDLLGDRDGGLLSWGLLEADFVRPPPHTLDQAFEDYMRFLDDAPGVRFG